MGKKVDFQKIITEQEQKISEIRGLAKRMQAKPIEDWNRQSGTIWTSAIMAFGQTGYQYRIGIQYRVIEHCVAYRMIQSFGESCGWQIKSVRGFCTHMIHDAQRVLANLLDNRRNSQSKRSCADGRATNGRGKPSIAIRYIPSGRIYNGVRAACVAHGIGYERLKHNLYPEQYVAKRQANCKSREFEVYQQVQNNIPVTGEAFD